MITARDLQPLVDTPVFRRLLKASEADKRSQEYRVLKGLERLAHETTRRDERARGRQTHETASVKNPRQSQQEIGDAEQHVPV